MSQMDGFAASLLEARQAAWGHTMGSGSTSKLSYVKAAPKKINVSTTPLIPNKSPA